MLQIGSRSPLFAPGRFRYNRAMHSTPLRAALLCTALLLVASRVEARPQTEWTVAIYAGIDEEEIAAASDPVIARMLAGDLPESVQLLLEKDTWGDTGVVRVEKEGKRQISRADFPEHDSSDPAKFGAFLEWVKARAHGKYTLLVMSTHSWGWKGIIQDFTLPDAPGKNRMMPLRVFAGLFESSGWHPDVMVLDACVVGNVDAIAELSKISRYVLASQRETPFQGLPYEDLFAELATKRMTPRRLTRELPERYVREYGRDGNFAKPEGEFDVVTFVGMDMSRWDAFVARFAAFTRALAQAGLKDKLASKPDWVEDVTDDDHNADMLETVRRLPRLAADQRVLRASRALDALIGYPAWASKLGSETLTVTPKRGPRFTLWLQRDPYVPEAKAKEHFLIRWDDNNQDLDTPDKLEIAFDGDWVKVSGETGKKPFQVRPWLAGVKEVKLEYPSGKVRTQTFKHQRDYVSVTEFGKESFLLSEAHTQGAPFVHGLGITLHPFMKEDEVKSEDRVTGLKGPAAYRALQWNQVTKWAEATLVEASRHPPVPPAPVPAVPTPAPATDGGPAPTPATPAPPTAPPAVPASAATPVPAAP